MNHRETFAMALLRLAYEMGTITHEHYLCMLHDILNAGRTQ